MICPGCRSGTHHLCITTRRSSPTWCDCQHKPGRTQDHDSGTPPVHQAAPGSAPSGPRGSAG